MGGGDASTARVRDGYRPAHYDHAFDYCTVDFDSDAIESYGPFGRTFDLFGDGSVRLVFTPGHSAGHMSVICRLPRRDFVICGDVALHLAPARGQRRAGPLSTTCTTGIARPRRCAPTAQAYPYALVVPGHDPGSGRSSNARYEE